MFWAHGRHGPTVPMKLVCSLAEIFLADLNAVERERRLILANLNPPNP